MKNSMLDLALENPSMYTQSEIDAIHYQADGSFDSKAVEVIGRKLYHVKAIANSQTMTFFDSSSSDLTVSNVQGGQLGASESHTVHELILKILFGTTVTTPNALVMAAVQWMSNSVLTFGIKGKTPWVDEHLSQFIPSFMLAADNAAVTNVKFGESVFDATFRFPIPKVIGEKVNIQAKIESSALPNALLHTTNSTKVVLAAGGITVRGR